MKSLDKRDQSQALSSLRTASRFESSQSMIRVWVIFIEWVKVNMFFTIKIVSTWSLIIWKICLSVWHFYICWLKQNVMYFGFRLKSGKIFREKWYFKKIHWKIPFSTFKLSNDHRRPKQNCEHKFLRHLSYLKFHQVSDGPIPFCCKSCFKSEKHWQSAPIGIQTF